MKRVRLRESIHLLMDMDSQTRTRNMRTHPNCSACRILRRRCDINCILVPYFPTEEAENFVRVHKVFGASNVIKMLQMVEESRREDAVKSLVYEAHTRLKDPVYGCTGTIFYLQKHVKELEEQLQSARPEALELKAEKAHLFETFISSTPSPLSMTPYSITSSSAIAPALFPRILIPLHEILPVFEYSKSIRGPIKRRTMQKIVGKSSLIQPQISNRLNNVQNFSEENDKTWFAVSHPFKLTEIPYTTKRAVERLVLKLRGLSCHDSQ